VKSKANIAERKKHILLQISIGLLILVTLLTTATYTWFEISKTPKVNDISIFINSNEGLKLSWDPNDDDAWENHLDFGDIRQKETVLKPVSYSFIEDKFYAARFGNDGRIEDIGMELSDTKNTNRDDAQGYYVKLTFYANTDDNVKVSLLDADQKTGTYVIGTPKWDDQKILHINGGGGAEYAVRVGFRITPLKDDNTPDASASKFIVYEPNSQNHISYNGDYISEYKQTPSIHAPHPLVPEEWLIRQTSTLWTEMDPVRMDLVDYKYGEFLDDTTLFTLNAGDTVQIELYLWLEGQDADCTNLIGHEASIFSSIQFFADVNSSGMEEIK